MKSRHLINPMDLSIGELDEIFTLAHQIIANPNEFSNCCNGKILATLFYEPSTRTRFSFEAAMMRLGGKILGFSEPNSSSAAKGETLADTIKMVSIYSDIIAMRHPKEGSAKVASMYSQVPVINAGDGGHHHPTQTLTDLLTIKSLKGTLHNHVIGICGDLKYGRTVQSLITAMSRYENIKFILISPKELRIPQYIRQEVLDKNNIEYCEVEKIEEVIESLDILYMTRIQKERFFNENEYLRLKDVTDKENNLKYDLNGNLLEYDTGGSKKILQYMAGTNKLISADINTFVYNDFGCVTEKNGSSEELKIQYDTLFPAKITSIGKLSSSGVIESLYSFHYDIFANVVNMIYSLPEAQTAISYHYLYSEDGRLEQIEAVTAQERDYECYVYVGNRPIAMLGTGEKWYGLVYDDAETLYMETKENEIIQTKYNAWGVPEEYNEATKCLYKKMNYIPDLKLYSNNGALYDPTYGITYVPIVENEACTPYRIINNVPFI